MPSQWHRGAFTELQKQKNNNHGDVAIFIIKVSLA